MLPKLQYFLCFELGGTVRRLQRMESLRRPTSNQILNCESMFLWVDTNISNIKFFFISDLEVQAHKSSTADRLENAEAINVTRSYHFVSSMVDILTLTS